MFTILKTDCVQLGFIY